MVNCHSNTKYVVKYKIRLIVHRNIWYEILENPGPTCAVGPPISLGIIHRMDVLVLWTIKITRNKDKVCFQW